MNCRHHPGRLAGIHFRGDPIWGLCWECFDRREQEPHPVVERDSAILDELVAALGDGVKVVQPSEAVKMHSLRMSPEDRAELYRRYEEARGG